MFDFSPFYETCKEKGIKPTKLTKEGVIDKTTLSKLRHGKNVELMTIAKICKYLEVPIEKVVRIKYE
ncbi:MAG: helix-turn-helix domain-containing protein [Acidobacterium ailaaui]|nr:helix-turn-helix domain-containing protein [Pseudacidobacterium ailaaui]